MMNSDRVGRPMALCLALSLLRVTSAYAEVPGVGQMAPGFELRSDSGQTVRLDARRGQGWTVLYFYPKAGTPGCTTQACAFRDALVPIRARNAEVYGISTDSVEDLTRYREKYRLNFTLLSDQDAKVTEAYGAKIPGINMAKRWTFIIDPTLVIRRVDDDVDPALDARKVADALKLLQSGS